MTTPPAPRRSGPEPVTLLSTRLSEEVYAILKSVTDTGVTQRAAVEHAIMTAYGPTTEDEDEDQRFKLAQEAYIEAVEHLLGQVEGPDEASNVTAALNACVRAHKAWMQVWPVESEEESVG